jgi:hypothetical protein
MRSFAYAHDSSQKWCFDLLCDSLLFCTRLDGKSCVSSHDIRKWTRKNGLTNRAEARLCRNVGVVDVVHYDVVTVGDIAGVYMISVLLVLVILRSTYGQCSRSSPH